MPWSHALDDLAMLEAHVRAVGSDHRRGDSPRLPPTGGTPLRPPNLLPVPSRAVAILMEGKEPADRGADLHARNTA